LGGYGTRGSLSVSSALYDWMVWSKAFGMAWCRISRSIWSTPSFFALFSKACRVAS
jgi:hypothetical protein